MRKVISIFLTIIVTLLLASCNEGEKAQEIYNSFDSMDFEESLLNDDEISRIESFKTEREKLLKDKDVDGLKKLKAEWEEFSTPLNDIIDQYNSACHSLISDSDKSLLTGEESQENQRIISKIDTAFKNRNSNALSGATEEYAECFQDTKDLFDIYHNIDKPSFSKEEQSILPQNDINMMEDLSEKTEKALSDRNLQQMKSVQNEWTSFATAANTDLESAKHKMLNDWMLGANVGSTIGNLFSFGTTTSSSTIEGHKIIYTTKYNIDYGSREQVENALNSYLNFTSSVFQAGVSHLKPYVNDICIRIEYLDKDGTVICYKEFN